MSASAQPGHEPRGFIRGRIISDGNLIEDGLLAYTGERIAYAGPAADFDPTGWSEHELPAGSVVLPGLVDIHCHGAYGTDFTSGSAEAIHSAADYLHRSGTTTLLASTVTAPRQELLAAVGRLAVLAQEGLIAGIHAEGPFLSPARSGAHDRGHLVVPDPELVDELVEASQGQLRSMTYAPELAGADDLVDQLTTHGIIPSLGHTDCDTATAAASLARAREGMAPAGFDGYTPRPTVTHLFNGMPPSHHRSPGPAAACLRAAKAGQAVVELISDGVHLDPQTVLTVFELVGADNVALVSDSCAGTGCPDGTYPLGGGQVAVSGGVATMGGSLAGGTATMLDVLRRAAAAGVPLAEAVTASTTVPAAVLGLLDEVGSLRPGCSADVLVATGELELAAVLRRGRWLPSIAR
ncbi:N-acetylglucosamine-6-phosphate deacetylase [Arthrobacter mobilis]|uniref:Amidohydrolase family protein n=1 Tax=Arthrobacter mobilis TaxID=2724944 RepID=A0A7X6HDR5_9MICC|nr:amidohydrolase family protein [Arthrobacter mobilis]NKX54570.1 amidohydrolase family protein [Arthrobacter mobilis]